MQFRDDRPTPHNNPSKIGIHRSLARFAMDGASANVILDHLAYKDYLFRRTEAARAAAAGQAYADNRNAMARAF